MKQLLFLCFLFFSIITFGQTRDLPRNAKPGKCYQRCQFKDFKYDKKFKGSPWVEVNCDSVNKKKQNKITLTRDQYKSQIKFKKYQEKLIALGYKLKLTGTITNNFIKAHNKYIRKKKRAAKKRLQNKV